MELLGFAAILASIYMGYKVIVAIRAERVMCVVDYSLGAMMFAILSYLCFLISEVSK